MERVDGIEIDHGLPPALVGGDLAGVDVVIAFGVAEPAVAAGFLHAHQTPGLVVLAHLSAH